MGSNAVGNKVLQYMETHLDMPLTIEQIANFAGYSEYHFARIFKSQMHVTVMEYVKRRKLIKASEDILSGVKIIDTAFRYGWQSHSGFTKAFKKEFGFYPSLLKAMEAEINYLGGNAMNYVFLESAYEHASKEELFEQLKEKIQENGMEINAENLENIYQCACQAYHGVKRHSGDEYVTHLLHVAIALAELQAELNVIAAGIFCDVTKKGTIDLNDLAKRLPDDVWDLVCRTANFNQNSTVEIDDEVMLIKLAERLHNMRTIAFMEKEQQKKKAQETIDFYMPLARRLNNKKMIDELTDLSMKYAIGSVNRF
ncbi:helix-turn-helix transcriptional regulator [Clostridium sp. E02]|uniref:helix-turn-helix transcriptional regulator n=1 Tax=Clostridium sp. E02 TaxID=2487134 RepID=UPI000F538F08|nr:helix-turn-helix transcriptional regulator [Clostridium sp. E02]